MNSLLTINSLSVVFTTRFGAFTALDNVSLKVNAGEIHGLVGESGAGKSTVGQAVMGLLPDTGSVTAGDIRFDGLDLRKIDKVRYHKMRGKRISMIMQDPQTSLNPLLTVGSQLVETIRQHDDCSREQALRRAIELLSETGIDAAEQRIEQYPHQFSGGMRQRVVIALALSTNPELIIADEPTTALDVSVQKQILLLIRKLCAERRLGMLLITHDIGVINEITDHVTVLRDGRVIETGPTSQILGNPSETYTQALMAAVPPIHTRLERFRTPLLETGLQKENNSSYVTDASAAFASEWLLDAAGRGDHTATAQSERPRQDPLLQIQGLDVTFTSPRLGWRGKSMTVHALKDINLQVKPGEVLGVVGESGSGKSTLAKTIVGLVEPASGVMQYEGVDLPTGRHRNRQHRVRQKIQMIFQDPYSSLNNRHTVERIIAEPVRLYGLSNDKAHTRKLVASMLDLVEIPQQSLLKYPHQFSGGQRQRIAIARALIAQPEFLICDEPTSALDVSIQAQLLNLLKDLQQTFGLTMLFISHNLGVIRQMAGRVVVLKNGRLLETAESEAFFTSPKDSYSQQLLAETPTLAGLYAGR